MELKDLREEYWNILTSSTPALKASFRERIASKVAASTLERAQEIPTGFSVFHEEDATLAAAVYNHFFAIADAHTDPLQGIIAVFKKYRDLKFEYEPELLQYALQVFTVHHEYGRYLPNPSLVVREPEKTLPSHPGGLAALMKMQQEKNPEDALRWYREDPMYNEHHEHWHIVYPFLGTERMKGGKIVKSVKDRQGEMFLYMHRQMLARFDAERMALSMPRILPFNDFSKAIQYGYDPGDFIASVFPYFGKRADNTLLSDIDRVMYRRKWEDKPQKFRYTVAQHNAFQERLINDIEANYFMKGGKKWEIDPDLLGLTIEASLVESPDLRVYGNYHNDGHRLFAVCHDPDGTKGEPEGVMSRPETSIRDSVFFEWHKHIDDLYLLWQDRQRKQAFDDTPNVSIRKGIDESDKPWTPDIIICSKQEIDAIAEFGVDENNIGLLAFGGLSWNKDFSQGKFEFSASGRTYEINTHDTITTHMHEGIIRYKDRDGNDQTLDYPYLNHDPFYFYFRIHNNVPIEQNVTVRLFMVPEGCEEDRRMYIELDKFKCTVPASGNHVVGRSDTEFSIIRKPAIMDPGAYHYYSPDFDFLIGNMINDQDRAEVSSYFGKCRQFMKYLLDYRKKWLAGDNLIFVEIERRVEQMYTAIQASPTIEALRNFERLLNNYRQKILDHTAERAYCTCGWPYSLLYPRGTGGAGMQFKFLVILTNWELDKVDNSCCSSLSFCGAKDIYPDTRAMGYPFDRQFTHAIVDTIASQPNMASRSIHIRCTNL